MAKIYRMRDEAIEKRIKKMLALRSEVIRNGVENYRVNVMKGNRKTGETCHTVSLIPIVDCHNCSECRNNCYDIRNDCIYPAVLKSRAINSAIHKVDPVRYWSEVGDEIEEKGITELRIDIGGDLRYVDFVEIGKLGENHSQCEDLFFTKEYVECNQYISENIHRYPDNFGFPPNVHPLFSRWLNMPCDNPYHVPESHVLWPDGRTTAPEFGAYFCKGNCSNCFLFKEGCPSLKADESVVFNAH